MKPGARPLAPIGAAWLALLLPCALTAQTLLREAEPLAEAACEQGRPFGTGTCLWAEATLDAFANTQGGLRRGEAAIGQVWFGAAADLERVAGWEGWTAQVSAYAIYGRQPTTTLTGSLAAVSNIEALSTLRLAEAWAQRGVEGVGSLRFGRIQADREFAVAETASGLISGTFGWPVAISGAIPAGGPAYPFSSLGLRAAFGDPDASTGLRLGVFAGEPGQGDGTAADPQRNNRYGLNLSATNGAFLIAEAVTGPIAPEAGAARPWVAKLGAWYHTTEFDSQRRDDTGLSLADPDSTGVPKRYVGNYGFYGIAEATAWRGADAALGVFGRVFASPPDVNEIAWQVDAGLAWTGPFGRAEDVLSVGVSQARVGSVARGLDRDRQGFGEERPRRSHETIVEANYRLSVVPDRLAMQPVAQWLSNPAARAPNDQVSATQPLRNAALVGLRVILSY